MWFSPLFQSTAGYTWWQQKTKWLRGWLQKNKNRQDPRMFVIEYFPYHTPKGMKFPAALPSYAYSDQLIRQAMAADKYIIIMRHWNEWLKRIPWLATYGKLARLKNPQNPCLTANNIDTLGNFPLVNLLNAFWYLTHLKHDCPLCRNSRAIIILTQIIRKHSCQILMTDLG